MRDQLTTTKYPGIFRRPDGILIARVKIKDPTTGRPRDAGPKVPRADGMTDRDYLAYAQKFRADLRSAIISGVRAANNPHVRFSEYAETVFKRRCDAGTIASPATKERYRYTLDKILSKKWGDKYVDKIYRGDVLEWTGELGAAVQAKETTPETVNGYWRIFKTIMLDAAVDFKMANPCERVTAIRKKLHRTFTREQPNSLEPTKELPAFLKACKKVAPDHYAFIVLGTMTGRRPCELRPLRWRGDDSDLNWDTGELQIRRSQYGNYDPIEGLKQSKDEIEDVVVNLTEEILKVLRWHTMRMEGARAASDLLFPPFHAKAEYVSASVLRKILPDICKEAKIQKKLSAKFMRRTYQGVAGRAGVSTTVQMGISGHSTEKMKELYSTAWADETKAALVKMCAIAGVK